MLAVFDRLHWLMPVGFYYKVMHKPRWMWPVFETFLRSVAGLGHVDREHGGDGNYHKRNLFTQVAVVGGGWAGLHAALEAASAGLQVTLIDEQPVLGGHLRHDPDLIEGALAGARALTDCIGEVTAHEHIEVINSAVVFGCYEEHYLGIQRGNQLIRLRADQVIVATGGWERPLVFENNDLPGNLLASAAQRLMHLDGCRLPGSAVVVTDNLHGYRTAQQLQHAGTRVEAIVDTHPEPWTDAGDIEVLFGRTIRAAQGRRHATAAVLESLSGRGQKTVPCRWIVQAMGFNPATSLLYQSGCRLEYDRHYQHPRVTAYAAGMHSAGSVNGTHDPSACALEGRRSGLLAALALNPNDSSLPTRLAELTNAGDRLIPHESAPSGALYVSSSRAKKKFACLCEDVTEQDLCDAIDEGYANIETLKRYSTISMGPCQGKMCQAAAVAICARHTGRSIGETGTTTARPPEQPVPLGVLAGRSVHFRVVRRTALHDWHESAGVTWMDAGTWKRPEHYTDPVEEYQAVRNNVGLIDVSTLGKIELAGDDVVEFLEFVYPNRFAQLSIGRVRYGVVCDEAGIILDDGTIAHLADGRFFLTTTTGNAEAIDSWFRWWLACKEHLDVRLTNVTSSYAAMNLAGPKSRDVLKKLCDADLSSRALPYLAATQFAVAGVPAIVLRVGFVGELGYEIHVPSQYGLHVWESIMAAGEQFGLRPFGVEAQRRLRLDKKHILAGHDTDALSNPFDVDLPWIVKLEKDDFIGRACLARDSEHRTRPQLVGFRIDGRASVEEGSLVLENGTLGGRVTSARYSPVVGATVGLAWVPAGKAHNGETIDVQLNGTVVPAVVQREPFYDPDGIRLKS